ncbi:hypothetical protein LWI28_020795 [Acer negundo]|uniref:Auxin-responsive protein n=1 Tax=Acer negundo TaxID=4023 RepID=A0AAD5JAB5_ACENE|nr:hypothetical protein LWI28_020795 [Acer negundo]
MELQLGLALSTTTHHQHNNPIKNKRSFEEAFGKIIRDELQKMPSLLLWSGQPNEEEDDREGKKKRIYSTINKENEEEKPVVGWPPIQSWRMKLLNHNYHNHDHHRHHHGDDQVGVQMENNHNHNRMAHDHHDHRHDQKENGGSNYSKYVKVKMEGVAITRKVNLRLYHSFHTLKNSLIAMFAKYQKYEKRGVRYTLTYQDNEGDWLLVDDVPWRIFIESVRRLEIVRNGG